MSAIQKCVTCGEGEEGGSLCLLEGQVYGAEQRPLHPGVQHQVGVSETGGGDSFDTSWILDSGLRALKSV